MEDLQPYIEVGILTDFNDENRECRWIKVKADNAYIRTQEPLGMAHYKIDEGKFIKILECYKENLKEYEKYSTNDMFDLCFIKYSFNGENYEFEFDYSNKTLMQLANNLYWSLNNLINFCSIDFTD